MLKNARVIGILLLHLCLLSSCSFNPFVSNNHTTGNPAGALIGGAAGAGSVAAAGGSKTFMAAFGIGGGALGYYVTTLRYDSGGIIQGGGKVYRVGDRLGIYIPTDNLFESNSAELLPQAAPILDSAAAVLARYPDNNIIISGNTSGFSRARWELRLSQARAQKVAAYLWSSGINHFKEPGIDTRKLNYVGYGDYFPISDKLTNEEIRENSRIQITSYPSNLDLGLDKKTLAFGNIGTLNSDYYTAKETS
ncbi:MAG: hypothetical protein A3F11_05350 [Gammaproteobacteria bacterium RIFCSPHIGHO2_12_FULL_37_14]|nr:MAG: hypothetical protein A3F11_05350 [Gammaproteobacteria bacterium RIFCSPHIGHO2_12_FULL_37_14]